MLGAGFVHQYPPTGGQSGFVIPFGHALRLATGNAAPHDTTLATCQQYSLPMPARDFHPIVNAHAGRTGLEYGEFGISMLKLSNYCYVS